MTRFRSGWCCSWAPSLSWMNSYLLHSRERSFVYLCGPKRHLCAVCSSKTPFSDPLLQKSCSEQAVLALFSGAFWLVRLLHAVSLNHVPANSVSHWELVFALKTKLPHQLVRRQHSCLSSPISNPLLCESIHAYLCRQDG